MMGLHNVKMVGFISDHNWVYFSQASYLLLADMMELIT